jgi:predicted PurR-regulated permease PerM
MTDLLLSDRQRKTIAAALSLLALVFIGWFVFHLIRMLAIFLQTFSAVIMPIAVAAIMALVIKPYYVWIHRKAGSRAGLAIVLVFLSVLVPAGLFIWFFGSLIVEQVAGILAQIGDWIREGIAYVRARWPELSEQARQHDAVERLRAFLEDRADLITGSVLTIAQSLVNAGISVFRSVTALLGWFVFPVYLAFFLLMGGINTQELEKGLPFLKQETRHDVVYLATEFINILVSFFRGQLVVALLQGLLFASGFALVGLKYGFVIGLMLGLLNIVPYLGSIVGLAVALPVAFFQTGGGFDVLAWTILVFTVVQLIESYILTPRIMGDRTGLHPMVIIIAIFFWGTAFGGIWGMILAIPLTAFLVVFWRLIKAKYIAEYV